MSYLEMITRALKGRSVLSASKQWGIPQPTLRKYANGERLPDFATAKIMAEEAGMGLEEAFEMLAEEELKRKQKHSTMEKISVSFLNLLSRANPHKHYVCVG
ncbi:helix-turn-helix transcriptional regulator [Glaciimonas soli]|uniref:Helix-turn-helix protein n=1 Tax=Glaciimonas soli TaxID=2590999 RepID=A0A843YNY0_9BURK|nr:helix-turn-helix transcriptional regulator [Glaciimonas soli]MQQ99262.1 hypothetical protein [Glaciimonas soli]